MKCSIVTACMNRNNGLLRGLNSWLKLEVEEIIIVDWSSIFPVEETLKLLKITDERIKIIRVENAEYWTLSRAFNLGIKYVTTDTIIKVDAEIVISESFLSVHCLKRGTYYRGDWNNVNNNSQIYINGFFYAYTADVAAVNGFSEYIELYGYDDLDLYERLEGGNSGLTPRIISESHIFHEEHSDQERVANLVSNPHYREIPTAMKSIPGFLVMFNELLTKALPSWGKTSPLTTYKLVNDSKTIVTLKIERIHRHPHFVKSKKDAAYYTILKYLSWFVSTSVYDIEYSKIIKCLNAMEQPVCWNKLASELNLIRNQ